MNMKTSEVLDLAADKIQEHGWVRGVSGWAGRDGLCLEGAIGAATRQQITGLHHGVLAVQRCPAYAAVAEYLAPLTDSPSIYSKYLWYYNDSIAETADDVIVVLRAAAAVERVKEEVYEVTDGGAVSNHYDGGSATPSYETEDQPLPVHIPASVA